MSELAQVGDFCPNPACPFYGKSQSEQAKANIIKFGDSRQGRQRYRCKECGGAFCERTGTILHNRKTPESEIIECLAMIAEGMRISSISRVKDIKEDTILDWIRSAGAHAEAIEALLLAEYELSRGQLDGLWYYVGNKGEKKLPRDSQQRSILAVDDDRYRHTAACWAWDWQKRKGSSDDRLRDPQRTRSCDPAPTDCFRWLGR